jgi:hypothetical protein
MRVHGKFCDLAKALDCIIYKILLSKLHSVGIQGATASWCKSLTDRKCKAEIKSNSAKVSTHTGEQF